MRFRRSLTVFAVVALWLPVLLACGPEFPSGYIWRGTGENILLMPRGNFYHELCGLLGLPKEMRRSEGPRGWAATLEADMADLEEALMKSDIKAETVAGTVELYGDLRKAMKLSADGSTEDTTFSRAKQAVPRSHFGAYEELLLAALPAEFEMYVRGAAAYRTEYYEEAIDRWSQLLDLPDEERRYRSTWAAFMLGKAWLHLDPAKAAPFFEKTRALAGQDFRDSLNLAGSSLGWQARAEEDSGNRAAAMHHYAELFTSSVDRERHVGHLSLRIMCRRVFRETAISQDLIEDPLCCQIVTSWLISGSQSSRSDRKWLEAVRAAKPDAQIQGAGRLAWAAYSAGDMELAQQWVEVAEPQCPYVRWVQTKLLLRVGKQDQALRLLQEIKDTFPATEEWYVMGRVYGRTVPSKVVQGEMGVLLLGRKDYVSALDAFARAGYREDAAYVAERVLTADELESYVVTHANDAGLTMAREGRRGRNQPAPIEELRYLLARRLARDGQFDKAKTFYPPREPVSWWHRYGAQDAAPVRDLASKFTEAVKAGRDKARSPRVRAEYLFTAAQLARKHGMELLGAEHAPDWHMWNGMFPFPDTLRLNSSWATDDEKRRAAAHLPTPNKRFHYRYYAADLMWECAGLLPDNDPMTARALWRGGTWLARRDPASADRFYKALVRRCRKLPVGREADRLRWFPEEFSEEIVALSPQ